VTLPHIVLTTWTVYAAGVAASFVLYGASQPFYVFAIIAVIGTIAGLRGIREGTRWRFLTVIAAIAFLSLTLWRHVAFAWPFVRDYSDVFAALHQYLVESWGVLRHRIEQRAYLSLLMFTYHEWLMPLLQVLVLILVVRQSRSNSSSSGRVAGGAGLRRST